MIYKYNCVRLLLLYKELRDHVNTNQPIPYSMRYKMTNTINENQLIETHDELAAFCKKISAAEYIAIDTEFVRDKTFYSTLCLIQIASTTEIACIDPLVIEDLSPLKALFSNQAQTKIFHAARQDLEIIFLDFGLMPDPLFDTQVAATLLGLGEQIGYGNLIKHYLNITLAKQHARTDWEQRPLSKEQIEYAANDVRYLIQIYPMILDELEQYGRRSWLEKDFSQLIDPALYQINNEQLWQKVSGNQKLRPKQLAVLQQLCIWRENVAIKKNKPRKWILSDNIALSIAMSMPTSKAKLVNTRGINPSTLDKDANTIIQCVNTALALPEDEWPAARKKRKLSKNQEASIDALQAISKLKANEHNISVGAIVNRNELEKLILHETDLAILGGWRFNLVGETLVQFLNNKVDLRYANNVLEIINTES